MPKVAPLQSNFNGGEFSPLAQGRVDADRYRIGLSTCLNYVPSIQGGLMRRPGTKFVAEVNDSSKSTRLIPFEFSTTQAYMLEFGDEYIRFYKDNGIITEATKNITGITAANPAVVTSNAHGYSNGDEVYIASVAGMTQLNGRWFKVANVAANTYELKYKDGTNVNSTGFTAYSSGGTSARVYTISSPYQDTHLFQINYTQSADTLYLVHPSYQPRKLTRTGHTSWTLTAITFVDGPYAAPVSPTSAGGLPIQFSSNTGSSPQTLNASFTSAAGSTVVSGAANNGSGLIRITTAATHNFQTGESITVFGVTGTIEANGTWTITRVSTTTFDLQGSTFVNAYVANGGIRPNYFTSTDVSRLFRILDGDGDPMLIGTVATYVSTYEVYVTFSNSGNSTGAQTAIRWGAWSEKTGWPACVVFHEDRLFFGGATAYPLRIDGSYSGDYENFTPTAAPSPFTVTDANAVSFTLNSSDVNVVRWLASDEKGLLIGTVGGEWVVRPSSQAEAITPTNISAKRASSYGSANIAPVQVGKAVLFVQRAGRKLRELQYFYDVDGFRAPDLSELAEHVTYSGITQIARMKEPQGIVWGSREDGVMVGMTYDREGEQLRAGWHRHILGGYSDAASNAAEIESVAVIPSADGTRDELWVIVKRYINGGTKRYVEYLTQFFDDTVEQKDAFFVDCGLTYDLPKTITGATAANPVVITSVAHGFSNGDSVLISDVEGMTNLNSNTYTVANVTADTFELTGINGTAFTAYVSGGEVRKFVSAISGLWHLEGQTVGICADGGAQVSKTISSGAITLATAATTVHIGFLYNSDAQMLRLEAGAADGTALGKIRRTHHCGWLLHRTLGLKIGTDFDNLDSVTFNNTGDALSRAPALFSGIISEPLEANYDFENKICWRQSQALPGMILAVMPHMVTQDRG